MCTKRIGACVSLLIRSSTRPQVFITLIEFKADSQFVATLETQYHRDERIIRYLTVALDKDAVAYAEKRRNGKAAKAAAPVVEEAPAAEEIPAVEEEEIESNE